MKADNEQINELNHLIGSVGEKIGNLGYLSSDERITPLGLDIQPLPMSLPIPQKMGSGDSKNIPNLSDRLNELNQ